MNQAKSNTWTKCNDPKGVIPPCVFASSPDSNDVLSSFDMAKLGYIKCDCNKRHYRREAIRFCPNYR